MMSVTEQPRHAVWEAHGRLPLMFVPNAGQLNEPFHFYAQGRGFRYAFHPDRAVTTFYTVEPHLSAEEQSLKGVHLVWRFLNARPDIRPEGAAMEKGTFNYFRGNEASRHYSNLPSYRRIHYREVWTGIDLVFYGQGSFLKYDIILQPGAQAGDIRILCEGAGGARLNEKGDLLVETPLGTITDPKPVAYQEVEGIRHPVECRFLVRPEEDGSVSLGFETGEGVLSGYPLVIDPVLDFSTYLGGTGDDQGGGIAVDASGNVYVTGFTFSSNFPVTPGAFQTTLKGAVDVFVTKLIPSGTALVYSTYLGGSASGDQGFDIAVDASGSAYVTGVTASPDFPTTPGAFQTAPGGPVNAFVTKLDPSGTALVYSTYLGGSSSAGNGIRVDSSGNAYVTGSATTGFPVTPGAFQPLPGGSGDAFVTKLNPTGTALVYSTYLGGDQLDSGQGIEIDSAGNAYITGFTESANFPVTPGALDTTLGGMDDAFVAKLNPTGTALVYSTYLGGTGQDFGNAIDIDSSGNAYVTGQTFSADFPVIPGSFDTTFEPPNMAFVSKLNSTGTALVYSTYLGEATAIIKETVSPWILSETRL
ncbi:SBBP repeat-containing protein [Paenibacillus sp. P26]|nr:SBBP repeat-containing protein [Paenibacillus sp. P26]